MRQGFSRWHSECTHRNEIIFLNPPAPFSKGELPPLEKEGWGGFEQYKTQSLTN